MRAADAGALLANGLDLEGVGPLTDRPVLAVELDDDAAVARLGQLAAWVPCVLVGVGRPGATAAPPLDVLVTAQPDPPAPWVALGTAGVGLDELCQSVEAQPAAAAILVQVLRASDHLEPQDAITLESLAYGALQAGPAFGRWLAQRQTRAPKASDAPAVLVERDGSVLTITLNRPDARNAYDARMRDALAEAMRLVAADADIDEVHVRGSGPAFCSGGDLTEFGTTPDPITGHFVRTTRGAAPWFAQAAPRLVAHVHGPCVGAGVELPAFARRVVAARGTTFRLPELGMGLIPGAGGTLSLPSRIGRQRTAWLALTGATLDLPTALAWGVVDEVGGG